MSISKLPVQHHILAGRELLFALPPKGVTAHPVPLLFTHGAFAAAWMWADNFLPWFAQQGYCSYALSFSGHGDSAGGGDDLDGLSIADYVEDMALVVAWLQERHPLSPALIGHSMGGFVLQKYLERNRASAAALLCAVPPQGLLLSQFNLFARKPSLLMELNNILRGEEVGLKTVREALFAQPVSHAILKRFGARLQLESQRALWDMSVFDLPLLTADLRPPLLVIGAEKDELVPAFLVEATARTYSLEARIFKGMGHAITHEQDWPLVAGEVKDWLDKTLKPLQAI
ncbi:MAG: lysophospholipase [Zoogloeaceae bacterium]|jgi:non-heme chloroperoxidase|nr:lysophospholipase [Zoogloeaceae bacterium]